MERERVQDREQVLTVLDLVVKSLLSLPFYHPVLWTVKLPKVVCHGFPWLAASKSWFTHYATMNPSSFSPKGTSHLVSWLMVPFPTLSAQFRNLRVILRPSFPNIPDSQWWSSSPNDVAFNCPLNSSPSPQSYGHHELLPRLCNGLLPGLLLVSPLWNPSFT